MHKKETPESKPEDASTESSRSEGLTENSVDKADSIETGDSVHVSDIESSEDQPQISNAERVSQWFSETGDGKREQEEPIERTSEHTPRRTTEPAVEESRYGIAVAGYSVQGARHIQQNVPCQDAIHIHQTDDVVIVCAADGHGDKKHARSDEGSQAAVRVCAKLLEEAVIELVREKRSPAELEYALRTHLPRRISWEWNRTVRESQDGSWHPDLVLFGTTIIGVAVCRDFALFVQLGDGDVLLIDRSNTAHFIFQADEDMYGTVTHSLCQPSNAANAKVRCMQLDAPQLLLISTDGIRDSLQDDEQSYINVGRWILQRLGNESWDELSQSLPAWLGELSFRGNGDDTTLGIIHWAKET